MARPRSRIVLLWLCGVLAAAQLGKFSALAPALRDRFALDLPSAGLLISLLEVGGALLGFAAGMALPVIGARRALLTGLFLLTVTTGIEAAAATTTILFAARGVEGFGYLLVVIAAPTIILTAAAPGRERDAAMVLWSTFVPVGSGLGSIATGLVAGPLGTAGAVLLWAFAALAMIAAVAPYPAPDLGPRRAVLPAPAAWLLCAGFGCYTLFLCAVAGLMPSFLHDRRGVGIPQAGVIAGAVALSALPGSFLALLAIRSYAARPGRLMIVAGAALVIAAALSLLIFRADNAAVTASSAAAMLLLASIARAVIFARLPGFSGGDGAGDPRVASAQGLLTQFGALGALLGPPLGAASVRLWSWPTLGTIVAIVVLVRLSLMIGAERLHGMRHHRH